MLYLVLGIFLVAVAGLFSGSSNWPVKCFKTYQFEHWTLVYILLTIVLLPLTVVSCFISPHAVLNQIPLKTILLVAALSSSWGIANIIAGLAIVKVGFGMTLGLLIGIGLPMGIFFPMIFQADGMSSGAPSIFTPPGALLALGCAVAIIGVCLIAHAGKLREIADNVHYPKSLLWNILLILAGVLQVGLAMSMVYGQPALSIAFNNAGVHGLLQEIGVTTYCMFSGAMINVGYVLYLMIKKHSLGVFIHAPQRDFWLSLVIGVHFILFTLLLLIGMKLLGSLGPSIGFGVYQITMLVIGQAIGLCTGEWRHVPNAPKLVLRGIALLLLATIILAASKGILTQA